MSFLYDSKPIGIGDLSFGQKISVLSELSGEAVPNGYLALAHWDSTSPGPVEAAHVSSVSGSFTVPPPPSIRSGGAIFIFLAVQTKGEDGAPAIIQPVLQWGNSFAGGGDYWYLVSCWVKGTDHTNVKTDHSSIVTVQPGQLLRAYVKVTRSEAGEDPLLAYECGFEGYPETNLQVQTADVFSLVGAALEAYELGVCGALPPSPLTFSNVEVLVGEEKASPAWQDRTAATCDLKITISSHDSFQYLIAISYR